MRLFFRIAAVAAASVLLLYAADAAWVRRRMASHQDPTGTVQVKVLLAIPQKNGRTEFVPGDTETQPCLRSVLPHMGLKPCWYVKRHARRQVSF